MLLDREKDILVVIVGDPVKLLMLPDVAGADAGVTLPGHAETAVAERGERG